MVGQTLFRTTAIEVLNRGFTVGKREWAQLCIQQGKVGIKRLWKLGEEVDNY